MVSILSLLINRSRKVSSPRLLLLMIAFAALITCSKAGRNEPEVSTANPYMTGTSSRVKEKIGCGTQSSVILNSSFCTLLIGWLLRSITRTWSVTSSVLMVSLSPSLISAVVGSGVGVGFGFSVGGGGGAPSCGAMRRPGPVCAGVGVGCCGVGEAAPVVRGRESTGCCALLAPAIRNESAVAMPI